MGDFTYLPLLGGRWYFLATWRDDCCQRVVGRHLAAQMPIKLVLHALKEARRVSRPHERAGAVPSFNRPGNPYDNVQAKAGWSTLKIELLPRGTALAFLEETRLAVAHCFDTYLNPDRRHSALGYRSPH